MRSPSRFTPRSWGWQLGQHLGLLGLFIALALIAMGFISIPPTNVTAIWLPGGLALAALLK
jgi:integral membrane sensor domain MASE1